MRSFNNLFGIITMLLPMAVFSGCRENDQLSPDRWNTTLLIYDAACQSDTLHFPYSGKWKVTSELEWITLGTTEGEGAIYLPLYIQENDDNSSRETIIKLLSQENEEAEIKIIQLPDANNGAPLVNLPKSYGLGWGYDLKEDYADITGVRGQVFDVASLINDWGKDAIVTEMNTVTNMSFVKAQSSETLQQEISGKVTGKVDIKVASAKVSVEYNRQISEQKDRLYVWCRDFRGVQTAYFDNDVDLFDSDVVRWCTTYSFQLSVRNDSPKEIVRKFGTHLVTQSCLGGKLDYYFTVSTDLTTEVEKIITAINVKVLCFKTSHTWVDENVWTNVKKDFIGNFVVTGGGEAGQRLNAQLKQYASKGEPLTDETLFDNWYACFSNAEKVKADDLAMVDFRVVPIWYIISRLNPEKGKAVEEYILKEYLR